MILFSPGIETRLEDPPEKCDIRLVRWTVAFRDPERHPWGDQLIAVL